MGKAGESRTCKDDDLPFCAFRVHEQFIVGDDGGHGGNQKPGSRTEERERERSRVYNSCGLSSGRLPHLATAYNMRARAVARARPTSPNHCHGLLSRGAC